LPIDLEIIDQFLGRNKSDNLDLVGKERRIVENVF